MSRAGCKYLLTSYHWLHAITILSDIIKLDININKTLEGYYIQYSINLFLSALQEKWLCLLLHLSFVSLKGNSCTISILFYGVRMGRDPNGLGLSGIGINETCLYLWEECIRTSNLAKIFNLVFSFAMGIQSKSCVQYSFINFMSLCQCRWVWSTLYQKGRCYLLIWWSHQCWLYTLALNIGCYIFTRCSLRKEISSNEINIVIRAASDSIVASRLAATSQTTIL